MEHFTVPEPPTLDAERGPRFRFVKMRGQHGLTVYRVYDGLDPIGTFFEERWAQFCVDTFNATVRSALEDNVTP